MPRNRHKAEYGQWQCPAPEDGTINAHADACSAIYTSDKGYLCRKISSCSTYWTWIRKNNI